MPRGTKVGVLNRIAPGKIFMWDYATARGGFASERCASAGLSALALEDLGAARLERRGHDPRPASGLALERLADDRLAAPCAPRRAPSGRRRRSSRRARRARARAPASSADAGTGARGTAGGGGRAGRRRRGPRSPRASPSTSSAAWPDVEDGVRQRDRRRAALPRASAVRTALGGHDEQRLEPGGRLEARGAAVDVRAITPPSSAAATLSGWPSSSVAWPSRSASSSKMRSAASRPGDERRRARAQPAGQRDVRADPEREAVRRMQARERAHARLRRSRAIVQVGLDGEAPGLHHLELEVQRQRRGERVEARPEVGRGAPARGRRDVDLSRARPARRRRARGSHGTTAPAWASAVCGSLRPWPVSTQTTARRRRRRAQQAGHRRGRGRLAEDALARGEQAVGVEDLVVGHRADRAARRRHRLHRLLPARRVADPDRAGDRLGVRDRLAVHERRGALGLEAEQPRRDAPPRRSRASRR